jgi:hypothetical protein
MKQQLADMAAAVTAADAARRRALRDEAALLQAMARLGQQQAEQDARIQSERKELKEQLAETGAERDAAQVQLVTAAEDKKQAEAKLAAAEKHSLHVETMYVRLHVQAQKLKADWAQIAETWKQVQVEHQAQIEAVQQHAEAARTQVQVEHQAQIEAIQQHAEAARMQLVSQVISQVSQYKRLLERRDRDAGCSGLLPAANSTPRRRGLFSSGLHCLWNVVARCVRVCVPLVIPGTCYGCRCTHMQLCMSLRQWASRSVTPDFMPGHMGLVLQFVGS